MDPNWSSTRYSSDDYDDVSGFMSNTYPNNSGIRDASPYGGNALGPGLVPYTQPRFGNTGQALSSTSHVRRTSINF